MTAFSKQVRIARPPAEVWDYFVDLDNAAKWIRGIEQIELITDDPIGLGTKFKETRNVGGRRATQLIEITAFDPPTVYTAASQASGLAVTYTYRLAPIGSHTTEIELTIDVSPANLAARVFAPLAVKMIKKLEDDQLLLLKSAVEST